MSGVADRYLSSHYVVQRLVEEYEKYGRLIVAVDFDSTIYDYHKRGDTFPRVIELVQKASKLGCKIIIYTCRPKEKHEEVAIYLKENNIPFDSINEPIVKLGETDGYGSKIFYSHFLDDRAGLESAYWSLYKALKLIRRRREINANNSK